MGDIDGRREGYRRGETALLLIDMQRVWLEPGLDPGHKDWGPDHYFFREARERTIPNAVRLLDAARRSSVEVLHTVIESMTEDGRDRSLDHKLSHIHLRPNSPEAHIVPALAARPDEIVLKKTSSGVFNSTTIDYILRNLGIRYLIVAGIVTDQCVDMAVRDGADRGYVVTCVADACAAPTEERHTAALRAFGGYCWIAGTDTVVARLAALRPLTVGTA